MASTQPSDNMLRGRDPLPHLLGSPQPRRNLMSGTLCEMTCPRRREAHHRDQSLLTLDDIGAALNQSAGAESVPAEYGFEKPKMLSTSPAQLNFRTEHVYACSEIVSIPTRAVDGPSSHVHGADQISNFTRDSTISILGSSIYEVGRKLTISRDAHGKAAAHYSLMHTLTTVCFAIVIGAAGFCELQLQHDAEVAVVILATLGVLLQGLTNLLAYESLKDRHSNASMLFNSLLQEFDFKIHCRYLSPDQRQAAFVDYMRDSAPQVAEISLHVPPLPQWIIWPISHGYGRNGSNDASHKNVDPMDKVQRKLKIARTAHAVASRDYKNWYIATNLVASSLIAAIGVLEVVLATEQRLKWIVLLIAMHGLAQSFLHMSGFQSLKDRHSEASMLFNAFVNEFDFKVRLVKGEEDPDNFNRYLNNCAPRVTQLMLQVPLVPDWIIAPIAESYPASYAPPAGRCRLFRLMVQNLSNAWLSSL